jgi:transposase
MTIVGGLDLHRGQLTFDYLDQDTGEVTTGRIVPADRLQLRAWLERFAGEQQVAFALEGCTGWRYVVEELQRVGIAAHLAEPAETAGLRGPKRRAKTDRADARHLRELLLGGRVPESWIAPTHVLEARAIIRLYKDLLDERTAWLQRVHATLFHQGVPVIAKLTTPEGAERLAAADLSAAGRQAVAVGLRQIQRLSGEMAPAAPAACRPVGAAGGLPRPARDPLRGRGAHLGGHLGRAGRLPPLPLLRRRRPPHRPGHHRVRLRRQAHQGPPCPSGARRAALGLV